MLKLTHKEDYVIDGEVLDWYLDNGLKLEDITIQQNYSIVRENGQNHILSLIFRKEKKLKLREINLAMCSLN